MTAWPVAALGDLCDIQIGRTPSRAEPRFWGPGHPWLSIADMNQGRDLQATKETITGIAARECRCRVAPAGTLVFSFKLSVGKVGVLQRDMFTNEAIAALPIRDLRKLDSGYLYHALSGLDLRGAGEQAVKGITLNTQSLAQLSIPLPPLSAQRRIAAMLDKVDAVRRKRRQCLQLLKLFVRSAYLETFGDPVRNEKGWDVVRMNDVVAETQYGTSAPANSQKDGLPVLRMNNITSRGAIDVTSLKWCAIQERDLAKYTVRRGDLLFNRTNSPELVGKTAVWDRDDVYAFAGYLVRVRFDQSRVLPEYVSGYLNSDYGKRLLISKAKPSINMSNISASEFRRLPIPIPTMAAQTHYVEVQHKARAALERNEQAAVLADSLFASLADGVFNAP